MFYSSCDVERVEYPDKSFRCKAFQLLCPDSATITNSDRRFFEKFLEKIYEQLSAVCNQCIIELYYKPEVTAVAANIFIFLKDDTEVTLANDVIRKLELPPGVMPFESLW